MSENMNDKKKQGKLSGLIKGIIGIGAMAYAGKKVLDLYMESEDGSVMSSKEYEKEINEIKNNYIEVNSGNVIVLDEEEFFNKDKVYRQELADNLFKDFLIKIESIIELPDKVFKISDIEKIISFESSNIAEKEKYNECIMTMLSDLDGRDYVDFISNKNLPNIFTRELNSLNMDNRLWINRYSEEEFRINEKYINGHIE